VFLYNKSIITIHLFVVKKKEDVTILFLQGRVHLGIIRPKIIFLDALQFWVRDFSFRQNKKIPQYFVYYGIFL